MATQAQINSITALYAGYFDRAPDPSGLQFWIDQIDGGRAFNTIAADFANGFEAKGLYPFLTAAVPTDDGINTFVKAIYQNLFNRAPETSGLNFWSGVIKAGTVPVGDMIQSIINGAKDAATATPPTFDKATMDNKIAAGRDFAADAAATPGFTYKDDPAAAATAKSIMDTVTNDPATVAAAAALTDTFLGSGGTQTGTPGETFTLVGNTPDNINGTANDDIIRALSSNALESTDVIKGNGGSDTLNISSGAHGSNIAPVMTGVEIVNDADSSRMDLTSMMGIEQYWSTGTSNRVENASLSTIFGTKLTAANSVDIDILTSTAGSSDTLKLAAMDNSGTTSFRSSSDAASIESVDIAAMGGTDGASGGSGTAADDSINIDNFSGLTTVKVTGSGDILVDASGGSTKITSVDTTSAGGYTMVDVTNSSQNVTANGGDGADDFRLGNGDNTVNTGAGKDIATTGSGADTVKTGAGNDILSGGTGTNTLDGGSGADQMVGQGIDTFVITTDDTSLSSVDMITGNFTTGSDKLEFNGTAGTNANYVEANGTVTSYNDGLSVANGLLDGTVLYAVVANTATGPLQAGILVFGDTDGDGTADHVVSIAGKTTAQIDFGDII